MNKGDKMSVRYTITTHDIETRSGIVEYVSRYGWVAVRFAAGYVEGFCIGNALKYLSRYRFKGGVEDLKKAEWYLNRIIKVMESA